MSKSKITNEYSSTFENSLPFWRRFLIYQKERFPLLGHGPLIAAFSFSAIAYSRMCRGASGFVSWGTFAVGVVVTVTLFLLLRIVDEFKDASDDARFRKELPVPRGLIRLGELRVLGIVLVAVQLGLNLVFFPKMLLIYVVVMTYLLLMEREFFVAEWLKRNQLYYVLSHMVIIPLVDVYASGLDWFLEGVAAPTGLLLFFGVSYLNGIVLEVGRKIRTPVQEQPGVLTYSYQLGYRRAIALWLTVLSATLSLAIGAAFFAGYGTTGWSILVSVYLLCAISGVCFWVNPNVRLAKAVEIASAIWTIGMYLTLGGLPMLGQLFSNVF